MLKGWSVVPESNAFVELCVFLEFISSSSVHSQPWINVIELTYSTCYLFVRIQQSFRSCERSWMQRIPNKKRGRQEGNIRFSENNNGKTPLILGNTPVEWETSASFRNGLRRVCTDIVCTDINIYLAGHIHVNPISLLVVYLRHNEHVSPVLCRREYILVIFHKSRYDRWAYLFISIGSVPYWMSHIGNLTWNLLWKHSFSTLFC